jgi:ADP-ribose pyrophosphatase YjhB (NUDIX family)
MLPFRHIALRAALRNVSIGTQQVATVATGPIHRRVPEGDSKERLVCDECGFILYKNPLVVTGVIATTSDGRILLCRRNIQPRKGYFGLPAGFMECGESVSEGAVREVFEETDSRVTIQSLLSVYSVPKISQVHMFFRASIDETHVSTTPAAPAGSPYPAISFVGSGPETIEVSICQLCLQA